MAGKLSGIIDSVNTWLKSDSLSRTIKAGPATIKEKIKAGPATIKEKIKKTSKAIADKIDKMNDTVREEPKPKAKKEKESFTAPKINDNDGLKVTSMFNAKCYFSQIKDCCSFVKVYSNTCPTLEQINYQLSGMLMSDASWFFVAREDDFEYAWIYGEWRAATKNKVQKLRPVVSLTRSQAEHMVLSENSIKELADQLASVYKAAKREYNRKRILADDTKL